MDFAASDIGTCTSPLGIGRGGLALTPQAGVAMGMAEGFVETPAKRMGIVTVIMAGFFCFCSRENCTPRRRVISRYWVRHQWS